jgi:hypothetical protein
MNAMRRPLFLSLPAALLAACASQTPGIENTGGDAFVIEVAHVSGVAAVEDGLAQAQSYCGERGRLFVLTSSQVGSSSYRVEFRCVAPGNVPPPPVVAAAPPPPPPARASRGRRATRAAETSSTGAPLGFAATLPPIEQNARPAAAWQPADANVPPANPPMTAQPLFAPPPGQSLVATAPVPRRMPPPDDSPLVLLPRLESGAVAAPPTAPEAAPMPAVARQEPPAAPMAAPAPTAQAATPAPSLPVITAGRPLPGYGLVVPSPNPLPGAPTSLPPIAGPARTPSFPSAAPSGFPTGTSSFTQGFR